MPLLYLGSSGSVGGFGVTGSGAIYAALTTAGVEYLSWDQSTSMSYAWDATAPGTGSFLITTGGQGAASCTVISATKFVCASQTDPAPGIQVIEQ